MMSGLNMNYLIFLLISFSSVIVLRFMMLNMSFFEAMKHTFKLPSKIISIQKSLLKENKNEPIQTKMRYYLYPVIHPSEIIATIATSKFTEKEFKQALTKAMDQLDEQGKKKLIEELVRIGILQPKTQKRKSKLQNYDSNKIALENQVYLLDIDRCNAF